MRQMRKRIINIANYHPVSLQNFFHGILACILIALFLLGSAPLLSLEAPENNRYYFKEAGRNISYIDLSPVFGEYKGSFVLYDALGDSWQIYNKDEAAARIAPASTFKIYSALLGLESGVITPQQSLLPWDGQNYRYNLWNTDQTLESAMQNSVTWYFQALDRRVGISSVKDFIQKIGYGNQNMEGDISSYWLDSSLKISPLEQVELLKKLYYNEFEFSPENVNAVKDSLRLYSGEEGTLYGKTGTEEVNGHNTSGWFIGFVEKDGRPYFFAANIRHETLASGPLAAELTFSVLSDLKPWNIRKK